MVDLLSSIDPSVETFAAAVLTVLAYLFGKFRRDKSGL